MRRALLVVLLAGCSGDDAPLSARAANPNLTVEPISVDPDVVPPGAVRKRRVGMGDHRRREEEDLHEDRRRKRERAALLRAARVDGGVESEAAAQERKRSEAELLRLSGMPVEALTTPNDWSTPRQAF